jgi:hypothetical protein
MTPWFTLIQGGNKTTAEILDATGSLRYRVDRSWNGMKMSFRSARTNEVEFRVEPKVWYTITQQIWIPIEERALAYFRPPLATPVGMIKARFWDDVAEIGELLGEPPDHKAIQAELSQRLGGGLKGALRLANAENAQIVSEIKDRLAKPAAFTRPSGLALRFHVLPSLKQVKVEQVHSIDPRIALVAGMLVLFGDGLINPSD